MKEFFKNMLSKADDISSKRVSGLSCIFAYIIAVMVIVFATNTPDEIKENLLITLFIGGLLALGVAAVEKIWNKK